MRCLLGLDDTDSQFGHCTTHLGFRMVRDLLEAGSAFRTYPRLVRLNPNVPFKTRGNAAVCIEFETDDPDGARERVEGMMRLHSDVENGANSGLVFASGRFDPGFFRALYLSAVSGLVSYTKVLRLLKEKGVAHSTLGNGMGVVGAAASLGFEPGDDHTYEIIAYRRESECGSKRTVDAGSVRTMERRTFPHTFNSYDHLSDRVLVAPHGPDPVLLGVRADSPRSALTALGMLRFDEKPAGHMIYLSNQCTDAHLSSELRVPLRAYASGWTEGTVATLEGGDGGHLYLALEVRGSRVAGAVYRQSADLLRAARMLEPGDAVRIFGGVRRATSLHPPILNVEKIEVVALNGTRQWANPVCASCGRVAKSEGAGKGFQCRKCGAKFSASLRRARTRTRTLEPGIYLPSPGAQRHLTKPLTRYGREVREVHRLIDGWFQLYPIRAASAPGQSPLSGPRRPLSRPRL